MDHMTSIRWRTSSYSGGNGGECVQVAATPGPGRVLVRDGKNPAGPVLVLKPTDWSRFTDYVKHGPHHDVGSSLSIEVSRAAQPPT